MSTPPSTKIHRHLVLAVAQGIEEIFFGEKYADKVVDATLFRNKKWGARDRKFFAENVYGAVRWWRKLWFLLDEEPSTDRLQQVWSVLWWLQHQQWPAIEPVLSPQEMAQVEKRNELSMPLAVRESIPEWIQEWGQSELKDRWPAILHSLNQPAPVDLRVNLLKTTREQVKKDLEIAGIFTEVIANIPAGLTLRERKNVFITDCYKMGGFEVQDRGSQQVAAFLPVTPGDRVIDACAGAGGKTLHLATLMQNKGKIIALDIHEWKLRELRERAKRNGVDIVETRWIDSTKVIKRLEDSADALLLDVPCSGLGVLRRHPDTKWKLTKAETQKIRQTQMDILQRYSRLLKPGGHLVYATCSMMPSENEELFQEFLNQHPQWKSVQYLRIDPDQGLGDGFFAARAQRSD